MPSRDPRTARRSTTLVRDNAPRNLDDLYVYVLRHSSTAAAMLGNLPARAAIRKIFYWIVLWTTSSQNLVELAAQMLLKESLF